MLVKQRAFARFVNENPRPNEKQQVEHGIHEGDINWI